MFARALLCCGSLVCDDASHAILFLYLISTCCSYVGRHSDEFTYVWSLARGGALIRDLGKQNQLVIKSVDPSNDYGIYRCEVENENGDSVGSAQTAVSVGYASSDSLFSGFIICTQRTSKIFIAKTYDDQINNSNNTHTLNVIRTKALNGISIMLS